jgi:phage repressor protein C with HTH and peptisase S24 domain
VPRLNVDASAGPGAFNDSESGFVHIGFDEKWLRRVSRSKSSDLSVIKVQGDSMTPTLSDGDDILVDAGDGVERLRDGIYVLRRDDTLLVKRIAPSPASRRIVIKSDNDSYPSWPDCELGDVDIIGRVVWVGRRLR